MSTLRAPNPDHKAPDGFQYFPPPLEPAEPGPRRTPAEEARTLLAHSTVATLATLSEDGMPWASMVVFGTLEDGSPVLFVSTLAEHGRNLERDARGSLMVNAPLDGHADPLQVGRVTLAGRFAKPEGEREEQAREAAYAAMPYGRTYAKFGDFSLWVLEVDRVRWVGGYGVMGSDDAAAYRTAEIDPVKPNAGHAVEHLNDDHADALLEIAQKLGGYTDATAARCTAIDRYGMDLSISTPRGTAPSRIGFAERADAADGLRAATVELAKCARGAAA
jgi:putative heme iron utilization protein